MMLPVNLIGRCKKKESLRLLENCVSIGFSSILPGRTDAGAH